MQPITTDTSDFEAFRKAGQTYVDKTSYFHRLITDPDLAGTVPVWLKNAFLCGVPILAIGVPLDIWRGDSWK